MPSELAFVSWPPCTAAGGIPKKEGRRFLAEFLATLHKFVIRKAYKFGASEWFYSASPIELFEHTKAYSESEAKILLFPACMADN
jgi:hypothetical protein